jgi:hypothetical protein
MRPQVKPSPESIADVAGKCEPAANGLDDQRYGAAMGAGG